MALAAVLFVALALACFLAVAFPPRPVPARPAPRRAILAERVNLLALGLVFYVAAWTLQVVIVGGWRWTWGW